LPSRWKPYTYTFTQRDGFGHTYCNGNDHTNPNSYRYTYGNCYSFGFAERDADALGDPASADTKTPAHAVSSADAVSE
jgi:hypothetical protein